MKRASIRCATCCNRYDRCSPSIRKWKPVRCGCALSDLAAYSLDVEIFAYVYAPDYAGFLEIQEGLLLNCIEVVEDSGTGFAFPSRTLYLGRDSGLNESRTQEVEAIVRSQREDTQ